MGKYISQLLRLRDPGTFFLVTWSDLRVCVSGELLCERSSGLEAQVDDSVQTLFWEEKEEK